MTCQVLPSPCCMTTLTVPLAGLESCAIVSSVFGSNTTIDRSKNASAACAPDPVWMVSPCPIVALFAAAANAPPACRSSTAPSKIVSWPCVAATAGAGRPTKTPRPVMKRSSTARSAATATRRRVSAGTTMSAPRVCCAAFAATSGIGALIRPAARRIASRSWRGGASLRMTLVAPLAMAASWMAGSRVRNTMRVSGSSPCSIWATSTPVMRGIELSRTIRSGRSARACDTAWTPSAASPTISKSGSVSSIARTPSRTAR